MRIEKRKVRLFMVLIAVLMTFVMMPQLAAPVYAEAGDVQETPAIVPVKDGIAPNIGGKQKSSIYFGNYKQSGSQENGFNVEPIKWRVLDQREKTDYSDPGNPAKYNGLFLLSDQNLDCQQYHSSGGSITWYESSMRTWLKDVLLSNAFSGTEGAAVATTHVLNKKTDDYKPNPEFPIMDGGNDTDDKIFLLSISDTTNTNYGFTDNYERTPTREAKNTDYAKAQGAGNGYWWLRSPGRNSRGAAGVGDYGGVNYDGSLVDDSRNGVRPALNLNLESLIFTSSATGGKSSNGVGDDALTTVGTDSTDEWKVTLKDDGTIEGLDGHKDFSIDSVTTCDGKELDVTYTGAVTGTNEYISAIITDKEITKSDAAVKYYGRLAKASAAKDVSVAIDIDGKLYTKAGDKLYVFNEQYNGDKMTDYASGLKEITISPAGHKWKFADFTWTGNKTDGYTKAVANYVCENNNEHTKTAAADLKTNVSKPTCTKGGKTTYTATISKANSPDGEAHSESRDARIPSAIGHKWGAWKVTKKPTTKTKGEKQRVCRNNASHVQKQEIPMIKQKPAPKLKPKPAGKTGGPVLARMTAKGKRSLRISWTKAANADGYDIFLSRCSHGGKTIAVKKVKTIKGNRTLTWTKKGLKKRKAYKAVVKAYVMKNGKKKYFRTSPMIHAYTSGKTKRYTNPKSVKVKKMKITLSAGESYKIRAKVRKLRKGKRFMPESHAPKLRYLSSDKKIAAVSKSGRITAKAKGSCKVFVYTFNGVSKTIKVTVEKRVKNSL